MLGRVKHWVATAQMSPLARQVSSERLSYLSPIKFARLERVLGEALQTPGDVVEFGVALGGSAIVIAAKARAAGRRFAGFDVFAMIPPPTSDKDDEKSKARYEMIASGKSAGIGDDVYYGYRTDLYEAVIESFGRLGVPTGPDVQLVKGLFQDTWPTFETDAIAFAHIDCDWYDPVRYCLEAVGEKLSPGGVIVMDDYNAYGGCRTATDEFLQRNSDFRLEAGPNTVLRRIGRA